MVFIKDKYKPKSLDEYIINRKISEKYNKYFFDKNIQNLIIYGKRGSGKYTLGLSILKKLFGEGVYNKSKKIIKYKVNSTFKEEEIVCSQFHYEIYLNNYILNNKQSLTNIIYEICSTKNVGSNSYKVIMIKNGDYINKINYPFFKHIAERYYDTCRLIITFNNISRLTNDLKGVFSYIRVPFENDNVILEFMKYISSKEGIATKDEDLKEIIKNSEKNINKLLLFYELSYQNGKYLKYEDYITIKIGEIINLINSGKVENIIEIRSKLYDLMAKNIYKDNIYKYITNYYIGKDNFSIELKSQIISLAATYQHRGTKGYREIIHLEAYLINIMKLIN